MSIEAAFTPANAYRGRDRKVVAAIRKLPPRQVEAGRHITTGDMELALAELSRRLPEWRVEREGSKEWQVTLQRIQTIEGELTVTNELAMWVRGRSATVGIGGFDTDVIDVLGAHLADRAGPQVFEDDAGSDAILFKPRREAKPQPAPKPTRAPKKPKRAATIARVVPLDILVDDLDPLARAAWLDHDEDIPTRAVTIADATSALREEVKTHKSWSLEATGAGRHWRATLERRPGAEITLGFDPATKSLTIEPDQNDAVVSALLHRLAAIAGPQGLVVGDEAVAIYFPERRSAKRRVGVRAPR